VEQSDTRGGHADNSFSCVTIISACVTTLSAEAKISNSAHNSEHVLRQDIIWLLHYRVKASIDLFRYL